MPGMLVCRYARVYAGMPVCLYCMPVYASMLVICQQEERLYNYYCSTPGTLALLLL